MSQSSFAGSAETSNVSAEPFRTSGSNTAETPAAGEPTPKSPAPLGGGGALPTRRRWSLESLFRSVSTGAGLAVLIIIVAIGTFLIVKAIPALRDDHANFFTYRYWNPDQTKPMFGIAAIAFGTIVTATLSLVMAIPVAFSIALCLTHYAPKRLATALGFLIDLLAAVPSIVFGLWGRDYLVKPVIGLSTWLHKYFGWIPIFGSDGPYGKSILLGSMVLGIMVLPIITALSREVFSQTPPMNEEAALALGATKWEMIRTAVLPYGRPGLIAATMLGLGRALGETMALALTLGTTFLISPQILTNGGNTIAANIVHQFGEASDTGRSALIASGLVLFAITLIVNVGARAVIARRKDFRGTSA